MVLTNIILIRLLILDDSALLLLSDEIILILILLLLKLVLLLSTSIYIILWLFASVGVGGCGVDGLGLGYQLGKIYLVVFCLCSVIVVVVDNLWKCSFLLYEWGILCFAILFKVFIILFMSIFIVTNILQLRLWKYPLWRINWLFRIWWRNLWWWLSASILW